MDWPDDYVNKIINADCLEIMRQMPDKCVDLVLTDPPYGIGVARNGKVQGDHRAEARDYGSCEWDSERIAAEYLSRGIRFRSKERAPTTISAFCCRAAAIKLGISAGECCPSPSSNTA